MPRKKGVPYARSDALKQRRNFSLTEKAILGFGRLVRYFRMDSASALLEAIGRGELFVSENPHTFEDVIATWDLQELAADALIPYERLVEIVQNKEEPNDDELVGLATSLNLEPSELLRLIQKRRQNGEPQPNGH